MISFLSKKYQGKIAKLEVMPKEDLDLVSLGFCVSLNNYIRHRPGYSHFPLL